MMENYRVNAEEDTRPLKVVGYIFAVKVPRGISAVKILEFRTAHTREQAEYYHNWYKERGWLVTPIHEHDLGELE